jgi:hypothetical protein
MANNILTIIGCHTNSDIKINGLLHNIKYFMEISNTIVIINSLEFIDLNIEEKVKTVYFNKNIIFNDVLTDELCYIYKTKYIDLSNFNNDQLREHWIKYGKSEKRTFSFPVYNLYFDYKPNDKFISHGKWMHFLNKFNYRVYGNVILTNDSFIITRPLLDLKSLINPNTELVSLLESYEIKHHYPDFLRVYNSIGMNKIMRYYAMNANKITDFQSVINIYEVNSSHIFNGVKVLYKNINGFKGNIHFDNNYLKDYLYNRQYPVVKIKKLLLNNIYIDRNVPDDFNANEYKLLNADLLGLTDVDALHHFKNHGMNEGRTYKTNQVIKLPEFLEQYMSLIGFKL